MTFIKMIQDLFLSEITFIIIDIALGSLMAFLGILAYGKTRKFSGLFFVLASLFMYLSMVFRILEILKILIIKDFLVNKIPVYYFLVSDLPYIFMIAGFVFMMNKND
jgi:hypothetical protein